MEGVSVHRNCRDEELKIFFCLLFVYNLITLDNRFKKKIKSVMNMLLLYLFASMKLEKGHKKDYVTLVLILRRTVIFYELG